MGFSANATVQTGDYFEYTVKCAIAIHLIIDSIPGGNGLPQVEGIGVRLTSFAVPAITRAKLPTPSSPLVFCPSTNGPASAPIGAPTTELLGPEAQERRAFSLHCSRQSLSVGAK